VGQWYGLFAPAGTPRTVVDQINKAMNTVLNDPATIKKLEDHGADVETSTPQQLRELVQKELARWRKVVEVGKLKPD